MIKRLVCLAALLLVCFTANASPPHFGRARFSLPFHLGVRPHVRDKRFWIMAAVQTAAMVADVETTERGIHEGRFAEGNPLFGGGRPGRAKLYSILGGAEVGELWVEHYLKASSDADPVEGEWKWWAIAGANTGFHATAAIHNTILLSNPQPHATQSIQ
ncbi:MAG: hypothetical protein ACRD33_04165 [Candidatus Acidiferrales bacterium]